jgi:malate dehydrogenase (oxaloacetate-decarboxylating)
MAHKNKRKITLSGHDLIREPLLNKGSAFTPEERQKFGLEGLLPQSSVTIEIQLERMYESLSRFDDPLEKYVSLASLQDRNEHLYYRLLCDHLEELLPIVYTPTVGTATKQFSHVFQRGRGVWITPDLKGCIEKTLQNGARDRKIRLIVVTDNESILGIGDQGAGGMAISIGKLALYTAAAGINPAEVLPVSLDVGTNNETLLSDPLYLGWRERRLRGAQYTELLEEFVTAVKHRFPGALVQWEDFRKNNALNILDRYRDIVPSFNDDIQGTGAVALAGLFSAARVHGRKLTEERVIILGAGAAGLGIFRQIHAAMKSAGITGTDLHRSIAVLDSHGLLVNDGRLTDDYKLEMAWPEALAADMGLAPDCRNLESLSENYQPTVLIGTSGQKGAFTEKAVKSMFAGTKRPVILPLSNPTDQAEATPHDIYAWTNGKALVATGSPFEDVLSDGRRIRVGQGNNAFIFPGIGLGILASRSRVVSDSMFSAAAKALAESVSTAELESGLLYPPIDKLRDVSVHVAEAVMKVAAAEKLSADATQTDYREQLKAFMWAPEYVDYEPEDGIPAG